MKYPAYPKYKSSGVEWLGDVPAHWDIRKTRFIFFFISGGTPSTEESDYWNGNIPWVSSKDMKVFCIEDTEDHISPIAIEQSATNLIPANTLLLVMRSGILQHTIPACVIKRKMAINQDIKAFIPKADTSPFYYARLIEGHQKQLLTEWRKEGATVESLDMELIKNISILCPPLSEQQAIADFLDRETRRIDNLIDKKERLIELLKEKRTVLISSAVTKGLNPQVKMKPSGVEWLGDVPEHWEVKKLRYVCNTQTGDKDTIDAIDDGEFPFYVRSQTLERIDSFTFDCEAVLTAGDGVGVGKVFHYVNGKFDFHQRVYMFNNFKKISGLFFFYYIRENFWKVAFDGGAKSTVDSLRRPMITNFPIVIPPIVEQQIIIDFLYRETGKIDALISKVESAIEKLKEYRTAIISAAVTGKINVSTNLTKGSREVA